MSAKKQLTSKKSSSDKKSTDKKPSKKAVAEKASSAKKPVVKSSAAKKTAKTPEKKSQSATSKPAKSTKKAEVPKAATSAPKSSVKKETKKVVEQKKTASAGSKNIAPKVLKNAGSKTAPGKSSKKTQPKETKRQGGSKPSDSASGNKNVVKKPTPSPAPAPKPEPVVKVVNKGEAEIPRNAPVLLSGGIKLAKVAFFYEAQEQDDHASKKKPSSAGAETVEKPTASKRHRASIGEETAEEIYARVVAELQEENLRFMQECSNQLCTKCCRNPVAPEFRVDKDLGYCEECAEILGLGHSKEARHLNYQLTRLGADSLDEARDDDDFGEAPSQQELEEADKDFLEDDSI